MRSALTLFQRHWLLTGTVVICMLAIGCAAPYAPEKNQSARAHLPATEPIPGQTDRLKPEPVLLASTGSLWDDSGELSHMFINYKARAIGDIVTIHIVESSSASNKASTNTGRSSSINAGLDGFFNLEREYPAEHPFFNPFSGVNASFQSDFDGSGTTARSNDLTAFMTARVVDILANGNLIIEGSREVRVNNENQIITVTGLVRPRDITAENIVKSTYIADARIAYSGTGVLNDRQKPGWLARIMDAVWPF